jgi:hypothetical protein
MGFGRLPHSLLVLALARAFAVYHIASGASKSFGRLPPLLLAPTRAPTVYDLPCEEGAPP